MPRHDIYIETENRESVAGVADLTPVALPVFTQEDSPTLRIYLLRAVDGVTIERVPTTGKTIEVVIGKKVGNSSTLYTQQFTWAASDDLANPYWEAVLPMDTAGIATLLGTKDKVTTAWFEVVLKDPDATTVFSRGVVVEARVNKTGALTVPAGQTPLSVEAATSTFILRSGFQGKLRITSEDGTQQADLYLGNDGAFHVDPVT